MSRQSGFSHGQCFEGKKKQNKEFSPKATKFPLVLNKMRCKHLSDFK